MKTIEINKNEMFAKQSDCFPTGGKKDKKIEWIKSRAMYLGTLNIAERILTPVKVKAYKKVFLMDVITGSLYDRKSKQCLSSDNLRLISYIADKNKGKSVLTIKSDDGVA